MTADEIRLKEQFDQRLKEKQLKYLVFGYVINEKNEMEYVCVSCIDEVSRDRNVGKLVGAKIYELKEVL